MQIIEDDGRGETRRTGEAIVEHVTDPDDPRLADYRHIDEPQLVRERGLFIAEGRLVVERVIADTRYDIQSVLVSPTAANHLRESLRRLPEQKPVYVCDAREFRAITGYNIHRGCLAIVQRPPEIAARSLLASSRLVVIVEAIANPDNIGGIFRNAAALGGDAVLLDPKSCDPFYRKAIRTSMAAALSVPFARFSSWPDPLDDVRNAGFTIAALTPAPRAEHIHVFANRVGNTRVALMLGTEGAGLSEPALAKSDAHVRIDIERGVDSLNVAVAAGIALYELRKRSRQVSARSADCTTLDE